MKNKSKKKNGFTIIEMIIVISIMAILAAIAMPSLSGVKNSFAKKADNQSKDVIERTTKMVLADKDFKDANETYNITFKDDGGIIVENSSKKEDEIAKELKECLSDIKRPQEENKSGFVIQIENSKVKVDTIDVKG